MSKSKLGTSRQRLDHGIAQGHADYKAGRYIGPFDTIEEGIASLKKKAFWLTGFRVAFDGAQAQGIASLKKEAFWQMLADRYHGETVPADEMWERLGVPYQRPRKKRAK